MTTQETPRGHKSERLLPDGTWRYDARVSIPVGRGERKRLARSFRSRNERDAWLQRQLDAVDDGVAVARSSLTFADYLERWTMENKGLKATTKAGYLRQVRSYVRPMFGNLRLQALTATALRDLYEKLAAKGPAGRPLSPATIRRLHALIHKALSDAVAERLLRSNVSDTAKAAIPSATAVDMAKVVRPWTKQEQRRFRDASEQDELAALWRVLLVLGLRRGEAAGLTWDALELDSDEPTLKVQRTRVVVEGSVVVDIPKSAAGFRTLSLDDKTVGMLRRHRKEQRELQLRLGPKWKGEPEGWVFVYMDARNAGAPIHPDTIYRLFQELVVRAGVPRVKLHALRHMAASAMLAGSKDLTTTAKRLGHAKSTFTVDTYGHLLTDADKEAARKAAAMVDA